MGGTSWNWPARWTGRSPLARDADIDAAILDVNLDGQESFPAAEILLERNIPFVFASGYGHDGMAAARFRGMPILPSHFFGTIWNVPYAGRLAPSVPSPTRCPAGRPPRKANKPVLPKQNMSCLDLATRAEQARMRPTPPSAGTNEMLAQSRHLLAGSYQFVESPDRFCPMLRSGEIVLAKAAWAELNRIYDA